LFCKKEEGFWMNRYGNNIHMPLVLIVDNTKIIHAVLGIGKNNNSRIILADEFPGMCNSSISDSGKIDRLKQLEVIQFS
jgi:hypothetical protein